MCKTILGSSTSSLPATEFDAVGVSIAKKLQRMHPTQAIFAESIINQVLTKGLLGTLTDNTKLYNGRYSEPFRSPNYSSIASRPSSAFSYSSGDISQSVGQRQYTALSTAGNSQTQVILDINPDSDTSATLFYENSEDLLST